MTADESRRKHVAVRGLTEITRHAAEAVGMTEIGRLILAYAEVIRDSNLDDDPIIAKYWQRDERYRRMIVCGYGYAYAYTYTYQDVPASDPRAQEHLRKLRELNEKTANGASSAR